MLLRAAKLASLFFIVVLVWTNYSYASAINKNNLKDANKNHGADEKIIRAQAENYCQYFAAADSHSIASIWAIDGTLIDSAGHETEGRSEIEKLYTNYFSHHKTGKIEIKIDSIRFPAANVAIEEGEVRRDENSSLSSSRYVLLHIKNKGDWQISSSNETDLMPPSHTQSLQDLSWLIGTWTPEIAKGKVRLKMDWLAGQSFINCTCSSSGALDKEISDVQIIGFDPVKREPTSWNFSSAGGFGRASWTRQGDSWLLRAHSIQQDGSRGEATYILHKLNHDRFTWQSVSRSLDGAPLADMPEINIVRYSPN